MKKSMALALGICILSSNLYGCSSKPTSVQKVYASEDIVEYNDSILEACNFEVNSGEISESNKIAKTNLDTLRNAYDSNDINYKVDITDQMQSVVDYLYYGLEANYARDKYPNEFDVNIFDELESEEELERQRILAEESKKYRSQAEIISNNIKKFRQVKNKDHLKYLDLVYETCEMYNNMPENYRQVIYNVNELKYEVEMLGGKLDKNFNIEKQKYLWDIQLKTKEEKVRLGVSDRDDEDLHEVNIEIETEAYTGPSDEELGLAEPGPGGIYDKVWEEGETWVYEETNEDISEAHEESKVESESEPESKNETESIIEETSESIEETKELTTVTSVDPTETDSYIDYNTISSDNEFELYIDTSFREYYDCVEDNGSASNYFVSMNKVCDRLANLDTRLSYENNSWYINLEGAPESGEIDLVGGYYISWIIEKKEPTKFSLTDYIYWDTNGFKVRCINESGRIVELEGYISDDTIFINNIESIIDKVNPARAYVYQRDIEREEDYYEESMEESVEETLEDSIETSTEDIEESTSEE